MSNIIWITGRNKPEGQWEILGIYDDELKAVERCTDEMDFVGPLELNKKYPEESFEWEGCYYPTDRR